MKWDQGGVRKGWGQKLVKIQIGLKMQIEWVKGFYKDEISVMGGDSEMKWGTKEDEVRVGHHLVNKSQKWKKYHMSILLGHLGKCYLPF